MSTTPSPAAFAGNKAPQAPARVTKKVVRRDPPPHLTTTVQERLPFDTMIQLLSIA